MFAIPGTACLTGTATFSRLSTGSERCRARALGRETTHLLIIHRVSTAASFSSPRSRIQIRTSTDKPHWVLEGGSGPPRGEQGWPDQQFRRGLGQSGSRQKMITTSSGPIASVNSRSSHRLPVPLKLISLVSAHRAPNRASLKYRCSMSVDSLVGLLQKRDQRQHLKRGQVAYPDPTREFRTPVGGPPRDPPIDSRCSSRPPRLGMGCNSWRSTLDTGDCGGGGGHGLARSVCTGQRKPYSPLAFAVTEDYVRKFT